MKKPKGNMRIYDIFVAAGYEGKMENTIKQLPRNCIFRNEYILPRHTRYTLRIREHELMLIKLSVDVRHTKIFNEENSVIRPGVYKLNSDEWIHDNYGVYSFEDTDDGDDSSGMITSL